MVVNIVIKELNTSFLVVYYVANIPVNLTLLLVTLR
jgi:hypothetical protein